LLSELEARLRARVVRAAPTISIGSARVIEEGFDSDALIVNDAWVFRFPRRPDVAAQLEVERALLPALAESLPLPVPRFEVIGPAEGDALPFVGYRMLPGEQLRAPLLASLADAEREAVAAQLAAFLGALHDFPGERALRLAPTIQTSELEPVGEERAAVEREIFPLLTPAERRWAGALYDAVDDPQIWRWRPMVTHSDLSSDHLLFDPAARRLSGVIDWGDVELGDPANDFAVLGEYGQPFVEAALRHYPHPVDAAFRLRMGSLLPRTLFRNLRFLVAHGLADGVASNLRELRERTALRDAA
jgi:aminoglycoside 2''-phosphotransferase